VSANLTPASHRRFEQANRLPQENDFVALAPHFVEAAGVPELSMARGQLTLIEHEGGREFGNVTWDYPGLDDRLPLSDLVIAPSVRLARGTARLPPSSHVAIVGR